MAEHNPRSRADGGAAVEPARPVDPNVLQARASNPDTSVWVSASAGTGKTKVLTDRVLRLLMPRADGRAGTAAHKILCLTFTKAGANEMALRVNKTLGEWVVCDDVTLTRTLGELLGREISGFDLKVARQLFAEIVDVPGGLKIMTIHAFCQSVLGRFPLEAGVPPYFKVLDDTESGHMIRKAQASVLRARARDEDTALLVGMLSEDQLSDLMNTIMSERHQLLELFAGKGGELGFYSSLCALAGIEPGQSDRDILKRACQDDSCDLDALGYACKALADSSKPTDTGMLNALRVWIESDASLRVHAFSDLYAPAFLTQDGTIKKTLITKGYADGDPRLKRIIIAEAERVHGVVSLMAAAKSCLAAKTLFSLGYDTILRYEEEKTKRSVFDYGDLILKTLSLLSRVGMSGWVMYKLDQGIDHILVDEAQDTNPEQWQIVDRLCQDFFHGQAASDDERTVFVVGDEKQSIYSFQRASPEEFSRMREDFRAKVKQAQKIWDDVDLNSSFRSVQAVLDCVDAVFEAPALRQGLGEKEIKHHSSRRKQAGLVEVWPIFEPEPTDEIDPWIAPHEIRESASGAAKLANHITDVIHGWITREDALEPRARPIRPGDIMILVKTRSSFVHMLSRALKLRGIPVSGLDRMILNDQIGVRDILALARFCLCPEDDLTLAALLKSPLIGLTEQELYDLAIDRSGSLWDALCARGPASVTAYLGACLSFSVRLLPSGFISFVLQNPCPADQASGLRALKGRLGNDVEDPLYELVGLALEYERSQVPGLQGFVHWFDQEEREIKREFGEDSNEVRIMTVHASKGLQAPIVILPDTTKSAVGGGNKAGDRLLWPDKTGLPVPVWSPKKVLDFPLYSDAAAILKQRAEEEYRRLLYVAMTRAEDRLYVGGYKGKNKVPDACWYNYVSDGMRRLESVEALDDGTLRYYIPAVGEPDRVEERTWKDSVPVTLPDWIFRNAPEEPDPPRPLVPSRPSEPDPPLRSPLSGMGEERRFMRGNLTHKLLELLPDMDINKRPETAKMYLRRYGGGLSDAQKSNIRKGVLGILQDQKFAPVFAPGSRAEVPVSGLMPDGRVINGQIDRLRVTDEAVLIVDYKSGRTLPNRPEDIPAAYRRQLQAYADALRLIYPEKRIDAALLWTDGPFLMPVDVE